MTLFNVVPGLVQLGEKLLIVTYKIHGTRRFDPARLHCLQALVGLRLLVEESARAGSIPAGSTRCTPVGFGRLGLASW